VEVKDYGFICDFLIPALRFMRRKGNGYNMYNMICEEVGMVAALYLLGDGGRGYTWLWEVLDDIRFPCMCHLGNDKWDEIMKKRDFQLLKGMIIGNCKFCCELAYMHAVGRGCTYIFADLLEYMNPSVNVFFQILLVGNKVMLSKLYDLMERDEDARVYMISSVHMHMEPAFYIECLGETSFCEEVSLRIVANNGKEARWIMKQLAWFQKILWVKGFVDFVRFLNTRLSMERMWNQDGLWLQ
jgi:hypothetical protein